MDVNALRKHVWNKEENGMLTVGLGSCIVFSCPRYESDGARADAAKQMVDVCLQKAEQALSLPDNAILRKYIPGKIDEATFVDVYAGEVKAELAALIGCLTSGPTGF